MRTECSGYNFEKILFNVRCLTYDFGHLRKHKNGYFASLPGNHHLKLANPLVSACNNVTSNMGVTLREAMLCGRMQGKL